MKDKYRLRMLGLSPIFAGLASYGINFVAALGLKSAADYSDYLSLQSWAVYFGSISVLCLVDMKLSPNGHRYSVFQLFGLATITSFLSAVGMLIAFAVTDSAVLLVVGITGFFYASLRNLIMVSLILRMPTIPISLRITRAGLLLVFGGMLLAGILGSLTPLHFMGVQVVAAACALALYAKRIPVAIFYRAGVTVRRIWELDRERWRRRNLSYILDMVHMPILYMSLGLVAAVNDYKKIIYVAGLLLPLAAMLNEIIGERFRLDFGLTDLDGLRHRFASYARLVRAWFSLNVALYACSLLLVAAAFAETIPEDFVLMVCLFTLVLLVLSSSTCGVVFSKAGLEFFDLSINLIVLLVLFGVMYGGWPSSKIVIIVSLTISTKHLVQQFLAYSTVRRKV